jgi:hypothetical protein
MEFSKKNLLSLMRENIEEMAMDFDSEDRPYQGLQDKLAQGDTPLKKIPLPQTDEEPNKNFQELLASERYRQVVSRVREYTGVQTPIRGEQGIMPLAQMMMTAHNEIVQTERAHREELEQLAIELVIKEMGIPEGALQFDAKIVGMGEIDTDNFNREMEQQQPNIDAVDIEQDLMGDLESMTIEKAKRRLINNMIQGASKKGHYMYHYVADKIREITGSESLIGQYGILMSINDTLYWQLSDETMKAMMGGGGAEGSVGGKEEVDRNTTPPTIVAKGLNFPILVHELIKGVMELFAIQGRPKDTEGNEDEETWSDVEGSEDTLEKEMWDLRLGPAIWDRIRKQFPEEILIDENKYELQNYLMVEIFKLPAREFLVFMKEVLSGSEGGKRLMNELMSGIDQMFKNQDYQNAIAVFNDDLENINDETDDDNLNDFLGSLGIKMSDDDDE